MMVPPTGPVTSPSVRLAAFVHATPVRLPVNRGKGAAVRAGVVTARGSRLVYMDVDMAVPPGGMSDLLGALGDADVAIGSRTHQESSIQSATLHRIVMGRTFHRLALTTAHVSRTGTPSAGSRRFLRPAARLLFHWLSTERFAFDVELLNARRPLGLQCPRRSRCTGVTSPGAGSDRSSDPLLMLADLVRLREGGDSPPDVTGIVIPEQLAIGDTPGRVRRVLGPTMPIVPAPQETVVLFPLCDGAEVDRLSHLLQGEFQGLSLEPIALSISDLATLRRSPPRPGTSTVVARPGESAADGQSLGDVVRGVAEWESSVSGS